MPNVTAQVIRTCKVCRIEIPTHKHRFCSTACRVSTYAAKRQINRAPRKRYTNVCRGCAGTYITTNRHSQVCSLDCRNWINPRVQRSTEIPRTHRAHPEYAPPIPRQRVSLQHSARGHWLQVRWSACDWCEAQFVVNPYNKPRMYCSTQCGKSKYRRERRARENGASGSFTWAEFMRVHIAGGHRCAYCDTLTDHPETDHVIPLARGGSNSITNIVPACGPCNSSKGSDYLTVWAARRQRLGQPPRRVVLTGPRFYYLALAGTQTCRSAT